MSGAELWSSMRVGVHTACQLLIHFVHLTSLKSSELECELPRMWQYYSVFWPETTVHNACNKRRFKGGHCLHWAMLARTWYRMCTLTVYIL